MKQSIGLIVLLSCIMLWSCSKNETGPSVVTPEQLVAQGWQAYAGRSYQLALDRFAEALRANPNLVDAYNGSGWANAKLDSLTASVAGFSSGLLKDSTNLQIKAGLSFVYNAQKQYVFSISRASQVLQADPNWRFSRDTSANFSDLHVLLAEDYFAVADFDSSLIQVRVLNSSFNADVTFLAGQSALANEIERLRGLF